MRFLSSLRRGIGRCLFALAFAIPAQGIAATLPRSTEVFAAARVTGEYAAVPGTVEPFNSPTLAQRMRNPADGAALEYG
jgi:hypothetical protein